LFCGLAPFLLFWRGALGGGDVKLFAAIGALCQPLLGIEAQMYALLFAAIFAPLRLAMQGQLLGVLWGSLTLLARPFRASASREAALPEAAAWFRLGPCILAGTAATLALHAHEFSNISAHLVQP
jgi:prepilin peptidase CpaA